MYKFLIISTLLYYPLIVNTEGQKNNFELENNINNTIDNTMYNSINNKTCILCENLVRIISYDADKLNKTIYDIIIVIKDICSSISGPSGKECVFILDNIQKIIKMISQGLTPYAICKELGFCNSSKNLIVGYEK